MRRFKRILVVADPLTSAEPAIARAVQLARTNKAKVTVVSVQRELERDLPRMQKVLTRQQKERLDSLVRRAAVNGDKITTKALTGISFLEIIREVVNGKHDLVIKPSEGRGGVSRWLFGSTDLHLLRKCPCPVWILKRSKRRKFSRLLAAVDLDPGIETNAELNALILDLATSLARDAGSELHIVHAWSVPHEQALIFGGSDKDAERYAQEMRIERKQKLDELLGHYDLTGVRTKTHLLKGDPGVVIPAASIKERVELVVMGTVARTGIPGFIIGNTAEQTLSRLDCSVIAVKPSGFRIPGVV